MLFEDSMPMNAIAEIPDVKGGENAVIQVPGQYLPGEFILRIDYRAAEKDRHYPAERIIYINKQDIELFTNPLYINDDEKTRFNEDEKENTAYNAFMRENRAKRAPIDLLRQFLLSYDRYESGFYAKAVKEFEQRRREYNKWLDSQAKAHNELFVSRLFQFQHIPATTWKGSEEERLGNILKNYFDGIDFNDPLIIRSRELRMFMDGYAGLYSMRAAILEERNLLLVQAGSIACEKASKGHPQVYGWIVDYFYKGYEANNIKQGMVMLKEHADNPDCLTSKRQQIIQRLEGMEKMVPGVLSPDFVVIDDKGSSLEFHKWAPEKQYKLLLFSSSTCEACQYLLNSLRQWQSASANNEKLDVIIISIDKMQEEKIKAITSFGWKYFYLEGGINNPIARDYFVLSVPAMFLIDSKSNVIVSVPGSFGELMKDLDS